MRIFFFDPRFIFTILWVLQAVSHGVDVFFDSFSGLTWLIILSSVLAFNFGGSWIVFSARKAHVDWCQENYNSKYICKFFFVIFVFYFLALFVAAVNLSELIDLSMIYSFSAFRALLVDDFLGERVFLSLFRVIYFGVGLSIFSLAFSRYLSRRSVVAIFFLGLILSILTTGRLYFLLFMVSVSAIFFWLNIISARMLVFFAIACVLIFFTLAIVFEKGDGVGVDEVLTWNARVYFMSSLACFNNYVVYSAPEIAGGVVLPNFFREVVHQFGYSFEMKPNVYPFAFVPIQCNTYTAFFPYYHDFGFVGVVFFMLIYGAVHQYLYLRCWQVRSPLSIFFYSISLYPLIMSVFEEAYLSSIGFWSLLFILPIAFLLAPQFLALIMRRSFSWRV